MAENFLKKAQAFAVYMNMMIFLIYLIVNLEGMNVTISYNFSQSSQNISRNFSVNVFVCLAILCGAYIAIAFIGISVLGSGLSDSSVNILTKAITGFIVWALISAITLAFLSPLGYTYAFMIYGVLTFMYAIGFSEKMNDGV